MSETANVTFVDPVTVKMPIYVQTIAYTFTLIDMYQHKSPPTSNIDTHIEREQRRQKHFMEEKVEIIENNGRLV